MGRYLMGRSLWACFGKSLNKYCPRIFKIRLQPAQPHNGQLIEIKWKQENFKKEKFQILGSAVLCIALSLMKGMLKYIGFTLKPTNFGT